jgi:hypothetical protein
MVGAELFNMNNNYVIFIKFVLQCVGREANNLLSIF